MLAAGVYFAVPLDDGGALAAAAGTHVFTPSEGVAGVGNIYTKQAARRRGFARQATAAVLRELVTHGISTICLNVAIENEAAISLYSSLGFDVHCEYIEGEAFRNP
jgi:ribosomal protein S18 acetylase RimI-like enzyme